MRFQRFTLVAVVIRSGCYCFPCSVIPYIAEEGVQKLICCDPVVYPLALYALNSSMTGSNKDNGATPEQQQQPKEVKVFVSGCYDILHGGHLEFWSMARALGTHLTVSFASDGVLAAHKANRRSSIPTEHKKQLIGGSHAGVTTVLPVPA